MKSCTISCAVQVSGIQLDGGKLLSSQLYPAISWTMGQQQFTLRTDESGGQSLSENLFRSSMMDSFQLLTIKTYVKKDGDWQPLEVGLLGPIHCVTSLTLQLTNLNKQKEGN